MDTKETSKTPAILNAKIASSSSLGSIKFPKLNQIKISSQIFIQENKEKFRDNYKIGHVVGSGSYGQVRKCLHIKSGHIRAVKLLNKSHFGGAISAQLLEELSMLRYMVYK